MKTDKKKDTKKPYSNKMTSESIGLLDWIHRESGLAKYKVVERGIKLVHAELIKSGLIEQKQ